MRTYPGVRPGLFADPKERQQIKIIDDMLRQVSGALSDAVFAGQTPLANAVGGGSGTPGGGVVTAAPVSATYITQTENATLTNEQVLSVLTTGLLKVTTGTGVLSTAVAADLPSHDHTVHANRTRSLWIPWNGWVDTTSVFPTPEAVGTFPDRFSGIPMLGAVSKTQLLSSLILPQDFVAGSAVAWKVMVATQGTSVNPVHFNLSYRVVAGNTSLVAAADATMASNTAMTGTADQLVVVTVGTTTTNLLAGSYVRLAVERDPTDAGDTNTDDVDFVGLQLDYTADM